MARRFFDGSPDYSPGVASPEQATRENAYVNRQIALENAVRRVAYADSNEFLLQLWNDSTAAEDAKLDVEWQIERAIEDFRQSDEFTDALSDHKAEVLREAKRKVTEILGKFAGKYPAELEDDLIDALTD